MSTYYIGLSVTYHDPALAIVDSNGIVLFAEATERYLQNKRALNCEPDQLFQIDGLLKQYCPDATQFHISINWRKKRPVYENMVAKLGTLSASGLLKTGIKRLNSPLENYKLHHMMACQRQSIATAAVNLVRKIHEFFPKAQIRFQDFDHHHCHAATACYNSPFQEAACAVIDSYGENGSMAFYHYQNNTLHRIHESRGTGSIGFYYMKITELCGFEWLKGEEWKVMGLAPYGKLNEQFYALLQDLIHVEGFTCKHHSKTLFHALEQLKKHQRNADNPVESAADLAYTGQYFFTELFISIIQYLHQRIPNANLTLGGGCALNSSCNGHIIQDTNFDHLFVPSAPADDGTALGAAWLSYFQEQARPQNRPDIQSPYSGSSITPQAVEKLLRNNGILNIQHLPDSICAETAQRLAKGQLVGWVQGRSEFGPRALGNRSILADPRNADMKDKINSKIKYREIYRPFAPAILHEFGPEYFENYQESPYMERTLSIKGDKQTDIPAVCHVDGTGRLQTVKQSWNPRFYDLISHFHQLSGIPVLLNTSFNIMGKPLVHSLEDCLAVFLTTGLDVLVIDDYLISKARE